VPIVIDPDPVNVYIDLPGREAVFAATVADVAVAKPIPPSDIGLNVGLMRISPHLLLKF
jgi:hypothetical protein